MIIGITGKLGSGKSTLAQHLVDEHGYTEYSFATPLKQIGEIFGFTKEELYGTQEQKLAINSEWGISGREFLQKVGTELFRDRLREVLPEMRMESSVWVEIFRHTYKKCPKKYVISDVRFLDEAIIIKSLGGILFLTERDNDVASENKTELSHKSEKELEQIRTDYKVDNNLFSIEEARDYVDAILEYENAVRDGSYCPV